MYHTNGETWRGLGKNATEGLAAPATILPMTAFLFGGQVLPFILMAFTPKFTLVEFYLVLIACGLAYLPQLLAAWRFRLPIGVVLLHPLGMLTLLIIQWLALIRLIAGQPSVWKGRSYDRNEIVEKIKAS